MDSLILQSLHNFLQLTFRLLMHRIKESINSTCSLGATHFCSSFTQSIFSPQILFFFFIFSHIHTAHPGIIYDPLSCVFILLRRKTPPFCFAGALCLPPGCRPAEAELAPPRLGDVWRGSARAGEVLSYVLISAWQRRLWEFHQHPQTKLFTSTSSVTQISNESSKKI